MKDPTFQKSKFVSLLTDNIVAALSVLLGIISYFQDFFPNNYKRQILIVFFLIALGSVTYSRAQNTIVPSLIKRYCPKGERNFRYLSQEKGVTVYENGTGLINATYEVLNEATNSVTRFPQRIKSSKKMSDLRTLEKENNFEIKSLDEHKLHWETIKDEPYEKEISIVFEDNVNPGDKRKYSVRYQLSGIFETNRDMLKANEFEFTGITPIFITDRYRMMVKFHPNYKYSEIQYCVRSPSKQKINAMCNPIIPSRDIETGGTFVEIEELNLWRNFIYRVEWMPNN
jgi:hypothetical protein